MSEIEGRPGRASWVPKTCTLPTMEHPLRLAEFDGFFATAVRSTERVDLRRLRLELESEPSVAARVADLMVRETGCCGFFTFTLSATSGRVGLDIVVPAGQVEVLDAIAGQAAGVSS